MEEEERYEDERGRGEEKEGNVNASITVSSERTLFSTGFLIFSNAFSVSSLEL
jgi:hypothetical protein